MFQCLQVRKWTESTEDGVSREVGVVYLRYGSSQDFPHTGSLCFTVREECIDLFFGSSSCFSEVPLGSPCPFVDPRFIYFGAGSKTAAVVDFSGGFFVFFS